VVVGREEVVVGAGVVVSVVVKEELDGGAVVVGREEVVVGAGVVVSVVGSGVVVGDTLVVVGRGEVVLARAVVDAGAVLETNKSRKTLSHVSRRRH